MAPVIPTHVLILEQAPIIWRYNDADIELGNCFPYHGVAVDTVGSRVNDVVDFEVRSKVVK